MLWYYKASSAIAAPLLYYKSTLYVGTLGNQVIALYDAADFVTSPTKLSLHNKKTGKPVWQHSREQPKNWSVFIIRNNRRNNWN